MKKCMLVLSMLILMLLTTGCDQAEKLPQTPFASTLIAEDVAMLDFPYFLNKQGELFSIDDAWHIHPETPGLLSTEYNQANDLNGTFYLNHEEALRRSTWRSGIPHNIALFVYENIDLPWALKSYATVQGDIFMPSELFLTNEGTVWGYGQNPYSRLGLGKSDITQYKLTQLPGLANIKQMIMTFDYGAALASDGQLWHWGATGNEADPYWEYPEIAEGMPAIVQLACDRRINFDRAAYALDEHGRVWLRGDDVYSLLEENTPSNYYLVIANRTYFVPYYYEWQCIPGITGVRRFELGDNHLQFFFDSGESLVCYRSWESPRSAGVPYNTEWVSSYFTKDYGLYLDADEISLYSPAPDIIRHAASRDSTPYRDYWTGWFGWQDCLHIAINSEGEAIIRTQDTDVWETLHVSSAAVVDVSGSAEHCFVLDENGCLYAISYEPIQP